MFKRTYARFIARLHKLEAKTSTQAKAHFEKAQLPRLTPDHGL
jgi:hypothetical protein